MILARSLAAISPSTKRSRSAFGCSRPRFTRPRLFRTTAGEAEGTVADRGAAVHGAGARLRGAQAGGIGCRLVLQAATTRGRVGRRCQLQRRGSCSPFLLYRLSALELAPSFILGTSGDGADLRIEHDDCSFMRPDSDHARPPALDLSRWKDALRLDGPASWTQGPRRCGHLDMPIGLRSHDRVDCGGGRASHTAKGAPYGSNTSGKVRCYAEEGISVTANYARAAGSHP